MLVLRLVLPHAISGSSLWNVRSEAQRALTDAIGENVETCPSEAVFDVQRRAIWATLGFDAEALTVPSGYAGECGISGRFTQLLELTDEQVIETLAIVMAETLEPGRPLIHCSRGISCCSFTYRYVSSAKSVKLFSWIGVLYLQVAAAGGPAKDSRYPPDDRWSSRRCPNSSPALELPGTSA